MKHDNVCAGVLCLLCMIYKIFQEAGRMGKQQPQKTKNVSISYYVTKFDACFLGNYKERQTKAAIKESKASEYT